MTTRFSPKTNCAVLAWLPRPFMGISLRGTTLPVYMLSVAAGRSTPGVNIGPALIDIKRSMNEELYMGADLSDPEGKWVYHSPMSWHPGSKSVYDHYSEDGLTTYNGTETFIRDGAGCTYEAHLEAEGQEAGRMNLRLRFAQPNMWSMAQVDFSPARDGLPASYGEVTWQGKTLNVDMMKI